MSSPFQKSFSAKSPITTSPLRAGGYGSGVDGMQYVSPKQPESNILPASKPKKEEKIPPPILPKIIPDTDPTPTNRDEILKKTVKRTEPGEGFEFKGSFKTIWQKMSPKEQAKHGKFEVFKKAGIDYINNYERINGKGSWSARGKTKDKTFEQDQTKTNKYTTDTKGVETLTEEGEYVNVGDERQIQ